MYVNSIKWSKTEEIQNFGGSSFFLGHDPDPDTRIFVATPL